MNNDSGRAAPARVAPRVPNLGESNPTYAWNYTPKELGDPVHLVISVRQVLPIIFVPGIMGSNLRSSINKKPIWTLNITAGLPLTVLGQMGRLKAGARQQLLHPARTEVDPEGAVPSYEVGSIRTPRDTELTDEYRRRGWGEVGQGSYHAFLMQMEQLLNGTGTENFHRIREEKIAELMAVAGSKNSRCQPLKDLALFTKEDEAEQRKRNFMHPVHACGYNWLDDNTQAALRLKARIEAIIAQYNGEWSKCEQVIIVTHSMGGLVARACQQLKGMSSKIAGIVHGVMPANGAAVAYRRCKVGMRDEDWKASVVIGSGGQEVTAVFAQAPGALQLLPTRNYSRQWLEVRAPGGKLIQNALPVSNPYTEIYQRRDRWWGLVKEEWLSPKDGMAITWGTFKKFLGAAEAFHQKLTPDTYHPNTYAFYGAGSVKTKSFERIVWSMKPGGVAENTPISVEAVSGMSAQQVQMDGTNPEHVGWDPATEVSKWELKAGMQDNSGDGTVPISSGTAPVDCQAVRQVFRVSDVGHEPAYQDVVVQQVCIYAISKIALDARLPVRSPGPPPRGTPSAGARP